jgi:gluconokinase
MRSGIPLTDADRAPWLHAIGEWMDRQIADGDSGVVACSALKRAYRAELLAGRPTATMVFLMVSKEVLVRRLMARPDHFFPEKLLESQLAAFEPPGPDEGIDTVLSEGDPAQTAAKVIATVWPYGEPTE